MELALALIFAAATIFAAVAILLYSTWLFLRRLRSGEARFKSFRHWLRDMVELLWV
jgi:hypothetical protein